MFCEKCQNSIPHGLLACPNCTEREGFNALRRLQTEYLVRLVAGECKLRVARMRGVIHLPFCIGAAGLAFCGVTLDGPVQRYLKPYEGPESLKLICRDCREAFCAALGAIEREAV